MNVADHIDKQPDRCGGRACVAGTRIRVWDIHVWHDLQGWTPEEIIANFPPLTLADVYAALAYYLDHREEIQDEMRQAEELVAKMKADAGPSRLAQIRQGNAHGNPVSP
jgi:uncharacterized protein (DUF433 family)